MQTMTTIDMLTATQAGAELGLADDTLLALINSGRLPAYNLAGQIRIKVADVAAAAGELTAA